ncbi:MAG: Dabb family protein, partial [Tannerella sp.]|nr:Dabb family protein [Tannerella sp.]
EIMHTVLFDLKHPAGSAEAGRFLEDGCRILTAVPGVRDFQAYRQCSPKNSFQYGFLMKFDTRAAFDAYTAHPEHGRFVRERWETEVARFQESDFVTL